jgi:hypothetical protein
VNCRSSKFTKAVGASVPLCLPTSTVSSAENKFSHRVARFLEKRGFLERDAENSYLTLEPDDDDAMVQLQGHSITYRIAVGPQQGRKVFA